MRILIADDSIEFAELTAEMLRLSLSCEIEIAHNGLDAVEAARARRPDALVLDIQMPGLDGIEVAARVREMHAGDMPYFIALTGERGAARQLGAIDRQFDRVFAKPLDLDQLVDALARLAAGQPGPVRAPQAFDLAELFTRAARQVLPLTRHLSFSFDYRGPGVIVCGDPVDAQCGLHRLLLGAVDMLASGFVLFSAHASLDESGRCSLLVEAAGTGEPRPGDAIAAVLARLSLAEAGAVDDGGEAPGPAAEPSAAPLGGRPRRAFGVCPNTSAEVVFSSAPGEGVLLRATLIYDNAVEDAGSQSARAPGARAWLVDADGMPSAWLHRRLQRLGWRVTRFASCDDALRYAGRDGAPAVPGPAPALLVVVEPPAMTAGSLDRVEALRRAMPPTTNGIFAVIAGSPRLGALDAPAGYELRVYPFSPMELAEFGALAMPAAASRAGPPTQSGALGLEDRPLVLLVDDNEINRIVGRGLIEALGYEVRTANDGLDAIDHCRQAPPSVVLMDLDMPVLNGTEAATRLRELQRLGEIPPFAIVAATADSTAAARAACERAGMDAYLTKPLHLSELRSHLRRYAGLR